MTKWEYLSVIIDDTGMYDTGEYEDTSIDELTPTGQRPKWQPINDLGSQGWELINFVHLDGSEGWAIFKRPLQKIKSTFFRDVPDPECKCHLKDTEMSPGPLHDIDCPLHIPF